MCAAWAADRCGGRGLGQRSSRTLLGAVASTAIVLATTGCQGQDPADSLGVFAVSGTLTQSCADGGLLAAPQSKQFFVELKRYRTTLHWLEGGERLYGSIESDGSFAVETYLLVDMRQDTPDADLPPCYLERVDQRLGTLAEVGAGESSGFSGELRYNIIPTAESDCSDLLAADEPLASELPCLIAYDLEAVPYAAE